jgi:hypothetical protein
MLDIGFPGAVEGSGVPLADELVCPLQRGKVNPPEIPLR